MARLSVELERFFCSPEHPEQVKVAEVLKLAGERIFGFLFVLLAMPSALPIPAPGYSAPFGIVILILAVQLIIGRKRPWLPEKTRNQSISLKQMQGILKAGLPWLQRIEAISRPRLSDVCTSLSGRVVIGTAIALMGVLMMIPIPGTNTLPAIGIFVTGFGLMEDDGAISLGGLVVCLCGLVLSISIILAVFLGGLSLLDLLKQTLR